MTSHSLPTHREDPETRTEWKSENSIKHGHGHSGKFELVLNTDRRQSGNLKV